ncbi:DinB superfamily protein [Sphingobacteriaceae bacterium GW460-11-11-14-LB5]|nr:DinB superfamily protein [Sphingobacteriaceae bacterium GW460-11-11-14-LB5]
MLTETLKSLFTRDLNKLKSEIELYKNEATLWVVDKSIANSAGNLCLHLIGNLNTYIGATLGGSHYIRNRELEFSLKDIPRLELIKMIEATLIVVSETLDKITPEQINTEYPMLVFQEKTSTEFFLVHLSTHLSYHLGQINYHRRLLDYGQ